MSGPKTSSYELDETRLREMAQRLEAAAERKRQIEEERQRRLEEERQRRLAEEAARRKEQERLQTLRLVQQEFCRLDLWRNELQGRIALANTGGSPPSLPDIPEVLDGSKEALLAQLQALKPVEARLDEVDALLGRSERLSRLNLGSGGSIQSVESMLKDWLAASKDKQAAVSKESSAELETQRREDALDRVLGHIKQTPIDAIPWALERLLQKAASAPSDASFDLQLLEIQLQVQSHNDRVRQRQESRTKAAGELQRLKDLGFTAETLPLLLDVEDAAGGLRDWDEALSLRCNEVFAIKEKEAQRERDELAGLALEQSLRDLGYEVDGVSDTVFAEGGELYFQRHDWGERYMRVRVLPQKNMLHFNLVREDTSSANASLDGEIERAWCADHQKILDRLQLRGVNATRLRAVEAGVYESQPVNNIPAKSTRESRRNARAASRLQSQAKKT